MFGDGSVIVLRTPGHTPGHSSLLVRLKEMGPVLLTGDLVHFRENYESGGVPSFNFDRAQTVASIERTKQIVANVKATVVIQHDMRDIGKLPAFPAAAKRSEEHTSELQSLSRISSIARSTDCIGSIATPNRRSGYGLQ